LSYDNFCYVFSLALDVDNRSKHMREMYQQLENLSSMAKKGLQVDLYVQQEPIQVKQVAINNCVSMLLTLTEHYSLTKIAKQCQLSLTTVCHLIENRTQKPRTLTFRKILTFYCWTFYLMTEQKASVIN
jgi:hypothetical protein